MFEGFANVWTPVELARRVGRKPFATKVAGEPVVLFRGPDGKLSALVDRCPHRGAALSLGKLDAQGCLSCPFHGWRFAGDGACVQVPLNRVPEAKRARLAATALPVRERGGLVWIRTSPGAEAPDEPVVQEFLTEPGWHRWFTVKTWKVHWTRAMENMLDSPHLPFVHRRTIGWQLRHQMTPDSVMDVSLEPTPAGFRSAWEMDGRSSDAYLEFTRPNRMTLGLPIPRKQMVLFVWCVPIDQEHTRMIVGSARNFGRYNPLLRLFDNVNHFIIHEDKAVVESSQPLEVPRPSAEVSVPSDRATLAFRSYYLSTLKPSAIGPGPERATGELPPGDDSRERPRSDGLSAHARGDGSAANALAHGHLTGRA